MGEQIFNSILEWLAGLAQNGVNFFMEVMTNILFNYDGLGGIALDAYVFFVWLAGVSLVAVCLGKIIAQMMTEVEGSQEANVWHVLVSTVKSGFFIVIMPFAISFTFNNIIVPISEYFIGLLEDNLMNDIEQVAQSDQLVEATGGILGTLFIWLFVLIVFAFFVIKMFIEQVQLMMNEIISPIIAISVVTDEFNMVDNWWKELVKHTATIILLTLSIALFGDALTVSGNQTFWGQLPMILGTGVLVISGPSILKSIWYTSGAGRTGQNAGRSAMRMVTRQIGRK